MKPRYLRLALTTLLIFTAAPTNGHDVKMASVDIQELLKEYHRTNDAQKLISLERVRIQKGNDERLKRVRETEAEMEKMQELLDDPALSDRRRKKIVMDFELKTEESKALDQERREFLERRNQALKENMVQRMKGILDEIRKVVAKRAKSDGYKLVLDESGLSTSQMPFLLYSEIDDLTPSVLAELNKDAPTEK